MALCAIIVAGTAGGAARSGSLPGPSTPAQPAWRLFGPEAAALVPYALTVSPATVAAEQHLGGAGEAALTFEFILPADLHGAGRPLQLNTGHDGDRSVLQIELPLPSIFTNESANQSTGAGLFDKPILCRSSACAARGKDGYWQALLVTPSGGTRELSMAMPLRDPTFPALPYQHILGVYERQNAILRAGDKVRLSYAGKVLARSNDWTGKPLKAHFRYRSFVADRGSALRPTDWTVLSDDEVQPLTITAAADPALVRVLAPLDVQAGVPFTVAVVILDRFGNPRAVSGQVALSGGVNSLLTFDNEWRRELSATYASAGDYKIVGSLPGARSVYHYTRAWDGPPPAQRLLGDVHIHTGDGGAQQKFLGSIAPGDHSALFTSTFDALSYLDLVAGYDFGAISEHAARWPAYTLPPAVAADPEFAPGGRCVGTTHAIPDLGDWWTPAQATQRMYGAGGSFITFPAYEWYSHHVSLLTYTLFHRVVLFRDFAPANDLPLLPTDVTYLPSQCLLRFLNLAGYGPDRAMVIPHMMAAAEKNLDWDSSYGLSLVASRSMVEDYQRVGELFSARAYNQSNVSSTPYYGADTWTVFEGQAPVPGPWTFRHAWRDVAAHIGVVGSSDNHTQMPGVNDDRAPDGTRYHRNEPAGAMVAVAATRDRGGVFDALRARRTYATTGVRAWLDFGVDGVPMGSEMARALDHVEATVDLMAGMTIRRVEIWGARVDRFVPAASRVPYDLLFAASPAGETYKTAVSLSNPVAAGGAAQEWVYYVRAFLETPGFDDTEPDDAVWSSPVWVTWSR